jgi:hypothetical protein
MVAQFSTVWGSLQSSRAQIVIDVQLQMAFQFLGDLHIA